jgi:glycosyltransferase involved in cell wall biosynthesis
MVPVVEAMYLGVPVVAYASTAVPETVGDAGLVLASKDPAVVAAAVDRIATDVALRDKLVAAGRDRVRDFAPEVVASRWLELLTSDH